MNGDSVSVVGLGKLGLCLAACLADAGYQTIGIDIDRTLVDSVNRGKTLWYEQDLQMLLTRNAGSMLTASSDHRLAIDRTDITFVIVSTPSTTCGEFSNQFVEEALVALSTGLRASSKDHHLFVISCTVMPGSISERFIPLIERESGRTLNDGFSICYDPEFVALGSVISGFRRPDVVVIGESITWAGDRVAEIHRRICDNDPLISRMTLINAELSKLCLNAYIVSKISFANAVASLCSRIPGADVDSVTAAIGADKRIGTSYFRGGPAYGGTCFPRDTRAYIALADRLGAPACHIMAAEQINDLQSEDLLSLVLAESERATNKSVGIVGLSYTANTAAITASPAIQLIPRLIASGRSVVVYDSLAVEIAKLEFGESISYASSVEECMRVAGVVVVMARSRAVKASIEGFEPSAMLTIVDCWRDIDSSALGSQIRYVATGRGYSCDEGDSVA